MVVPTTFTGFAEEVPLQSGVWRSFPLSKCSFDLIHYFSQSLITAFKTPGRSSFWRWLRKSDNGLIFPTLPRMTGTRQVHGEPRIYSRLHRCGRPNFCVLTTLAAKQHAMSFNLWLTFQCSWTTSVIDNWIATCMAPENPTHPWPATPHGTLVCSCHSWCSWDGWSISWSASLGPNSSVTTRGLNLTCGLQCDCHETWYLRY